MAARTAAQVMARQQWKKRIAKQAAARRKERFQPSRELIQFLACGGVFVLLTAFKLLSADHALPLRETLGQAMERNLDVQEVFSTLGDAFAGEENAAGRLYQAVFQPGNWAADDPHTLAADAGETVHVWSGTLRDGAALETLWSYQALPVGSAADETENAESNGANHSEMERRTEKSILYGGQPLPAGVRMEQAILNFDYAAPLDGTLVSAFGYREDSIEGGNRFHYGVDLAAEEGADIFSFADGVVTAVGESSSYGKYCMVSHGGNCVSIYAHCKRIAVSSGQEVRLGEKIAEVGETGQAAGPRLHFELQQNGIYLNPIYYAA